MKKWLLLVFSLLVLVILSSCGGGEITLEEALAAPTDDDRQDVLHYMGRPDAFDIAVIQVEGGQVRLESWRYFSFGTRIDFVDGEAVWTYELEPVVEGAIFPAWYDPLAFQAGMGVEETSQLLTSASPAEAEPELIPLEEVGEGFETGVMLVGDQIILGFEDDQLVYVETVALIPRGGQR